MATESSSKAGVGLLALVALLLAGGLRYYSIWGVADTGGACRTRLGCKSQLCASHAFAGRDRDRSGGPLHPSPGYCTVKCSSDADCGQPGQASLRCVATPAEIKQDIPGIGIPDHLCVRVE